MGWRSISLSLRSCSRGSLLVGLLLRSRFFTDCPPSWRRSTWSVSLRGGAPHGSVAAWCHSVRQQGVGQLEWDATPPDPCTFYKSHRPEPHALHERGGTG